MSDSALALFGLPKVLDTNKCCGAEVCEDGIAPVIAVIDENIDLGLVLYFGRDTMGRDDVLLEYHHERFHSGGDTRSLERLDTTVKRSALVTDEDRGYQTSRFAISIYLLCFPSS